MKRLQSVVLPLSVLSSFHIQTLSPVDPGLVSTQTFKPTQYLRESRSERSKHFTSIIFMDKVTSQQHS